jgi:hypothetical protein
MEAERAMKKQERRGKQKFGGQIMMNQKQPYSSPRLECYGNVRDLTSAIAHNNPRLDGINNSTFNTPGKTH